MNDRRNQVPSFISMLLLILGCGSSNTVMIGISDSYTEVADGDSTQISVPLSETNLPHYFQGVPTATRAARSCWTTHL